MTIAEQKAAQRKAGIAARRALSEVDRTSANAALCARIAGLDCFRTAQNILLYAAFGGEADLSALSGQAAAQGKTLAWPVCGEGFSLTAAVPEANGWEVGAYGIRTPVRAGALHSFRRRLPPGGHGEGLLRPLSSPLHPGCKGRRRL